MKEDVKVGLEAAVKGWGGGVTPGHGNMETTITTASGRKLAVKYIVQVFCPPNLQSFEMAYARLGRRLHQDSGHGSMDRVYQQFRVLARH